MFFADSCNRFQIYFPHVDNVYSHRSTQRHKRRRFVSHYWDCRLKGRPPGTKKSTDPDKKKRKRVARERDLCDVKIKITEYFDGAELTEQTGLQPPVETHTPFDASGSGTQFFGQSHGGMSWPATSTLNANGQPKKFYTLQRVNGNGGNGKGDGVAGPHKHTLEESDRVKKNSVQRWLMKNEREKKKAQVRRLSMLSFLIWCCRAAELPALLSPVTRRRFIAALKHCMAPARTTTNHDHHVMDPPPTPRMQGACGMMSDNVTATRSCGHGLYFPLCTCTDRALRRPLLHIHPLCIQASDIFNLCLCTFKTLQSVCSQQHD